jgi:hypothetical protein
MTANAPVQSRLVFECMLVVHMVQQPRSHQIIPQQHCFSLRACATAAVRPDSAKLLAPPTTMCMSPCKRLQVSQMTA